MVKIKGLIIFEKQKLKGKLKSLVGIYETEIKEYGGKSVYILKTDKYNDTVRKRFIRRGIRELAYYPETVENRNVLSGEGFKLISERNLIKNHISEIIRKYAGSWGIAKGKLKLAVASPDPTNILKELEKLSDWLSEVILCGKKNGRALSAADSFYNETGIGVIPVNTLKEEQCNLLVAERASDIPIGFKETAICLEGGEAAGCKLIKGVKLKLPEEVRINGIDDIIISELFDFKFKISGLKNT